MNGLKRPTGWVAIGALVTVIVVVAAALAFTQNKELYSGKIAVGPNPLTVVLDPPRKRAFVLNRGMTNNRDEPLGPGTLTVINSESGKVVNTVQVGLYPTAAAVNHRTGRVFVANRGFYEPGGLAPEPGTVTILDATSGRALHTVEVGIGPHALTVDEQGERVLVLNSGGRTEPGSVSVLDSTLGTALGQITTDSYPADAVVNSLDGVAFVANTGTNTLSILDLKGLQVIKTVEVRHTLEGEAGTLARLVFDERTAHMFALNFSYPPVFAGSGPNNGSLTLLDAQRAEILNTVVMTNPVGMALSAQTGQVFVIGYENDEGWLTALDVESGKVLWNAQLGANPRGIALDEGAGKFYMPNYDSGTVSVLDTQDGRILCTFGVGEPPRVIAVESQTHRVFIVSAKDNSLSILKPTC